MILDEMQSAIRDTVRDFARDRLWPETQAFEAAGGYPPALFEEMVALGLVGMTAPAAFGGAEAMAISRNIGSPNSIATSASARSTRARRTFSAW